jgi:hypothetical protein
MYMFHDSLNLSPFRGGGVDWRKTVSRVVGFSRCHVGALNSELTDTSGYLPGSSTYIHDAYLGIYLPSGSGYSAAGGYCTVLYCTPYKELANDIFRHLTYGVGRKKKIPPYSSNLIMFLILLPPWRGVLLSSFSPLYKRKMNTTA